MVDFGINLHPSILKNRKGIDSKYDIKHQAKHFDPGSPNPNLKHSNITTNNYYYSSRDVHE